ncbi:hypothetical protein [Spirosoma foliorum]|uniref:Uncharacterized protein n=1 Tax=Spirosoma foliorum TaxID=2710596 RepID=A0A7G5GUD8_9BACT|nr:hypothetical protein [Spirosoma foliorum]QMW02480.1 hypothetical protein H3H32_31990 [Spirosoma foliorum]
MYILTLPSGSVSLYDSPYKLPESQRVEYDYYSLIHSAIGSGIEDIDRHFELMAGLVVAEPEDQLMAINNLRYLLANLLGKQIAPNILALCCLVESVNGTTWDDYSPEGVEQLAGRLSELGVCQEHTVGISALYENILKPLQRQYPNHFPNTQHEADLRLHKALLFEADELLQPDDPTLDFRRKDIELENVEAIKPPPHGRLRQSS